jgi:hypothetical protein
VEEVDRRQSIRLRAHPVGQMSPFAHVARRRPLLDRMFGRDLHQALHPDLHQDRRSIEAAGEALSSYLTVRRSPNGPGCGFV